jgi:hypothetical protein
MEISKNVIVYAKEGDLEFHMGHGLTSFHYKGQEKFTFRTREVDAVIAMLQAAKAELDKPENCAKVSS